jgi:hypothetical protein
METMEISSGIVVRINLGNFQHIELIKSNKKVINYSDEADRIRQEDLMTSELVDCMKRDMSSIPSRLGKPDAPIAQVEESIKKVIPEWLAKSSVPNIADPVTKREIQVTAEQKNALDTEKKKQNLDVDDKPKGISGIVPSLKSQAAPVKAPTAPATTLPPKAEEKAKVDDLFDEIEPSAPTASAAEVKTSVVADKKEETKSSPKKDDDDFDWN